MRSLVTKVSSKPSILYSYWKAQTRSVPVGDVAYPAPPNGSGMKTAILVGAIVALLGANVYMYLQLDRVKTDVAKLRESVLTEITNLRETSSVTSQTAKRHL